jgi:CheY-like chemotaxis protein
MPLIRLNDIFNLPAKGIIERRYFSVIVVQAVEKKLGLLVDELKGRQDIVGKTLDEPLNNIKYISGATILGDGRVILIIDAPSIIDSFEGGLPVRRQDVSMASSIDLPAKKRRKTILLAEDAISTAMLEKNVLESAGFSVVIARDGQEAHEKSAQEKFDLVITDILMPRMDGFELTVTLRKDKLYKNIPIIIVTTRESDADKRRGLEAGANAYILKSEFTSESLLNTIERLIG